jgi:glucose/arabinose dehydrogenase
MADVNLVTGNDGSNSLQGSSGTDLIYGWNPNGPQGSVSTITATRVASGLSQPLFVTSAPKDPDRLFIVEKGGLIKVLNLATGAVDPEPFLNVSGQIVTAGEQGLLGLDFHPDYPENGRFYVYLSNAAGDSEVREYRVSANDPTRADPASGKVVLTVDQPAFTNHKAGWIEFGPDGKLYIALGDGGGGDPANNAQNTNSLLGKILRIDVNADGFPADPGRNYAIPADNPFVGVAGADEVWAYGLRNPFRNGFDRGTGDLYIADVGQGTWEEINLGAPGANYGWKRYEGPAVFDPNTPLNGTPTFPIDYYGHDIGRSVTGGYVYRGQSEGLHGHYFFGDFVSDRIWTLENENGAWRATERTGQIVPNAGTLDGITSFGEDALGNLYVTSFDGEVFRLTPQVTSADAADTLGGREGDDTIFAGSGNDRLFGEAGIDTLNGMNGHDVLDGGIGNDSMVGGAGLDTASYYTALAGVRVHLDYSLAQNTLGAGIDRIRQVENLEGSRFNDALFDNSGANTLNGRDGDDWLYSRLGNDILIGGTGLDVADYAFATSRVVVNLATQTASGTGIGSDRLAQIENAFGGSGADALTGSAGANRLNGKAGLDDLTGGGGLDVLTGGLGTSDDFNYVAVTDSAGVGDLITDFEVGSDNIDVSALSAQLFTFSGERTTFNTATAPELRYVKDTANNLTHVYGDVNGDNATDLHIRETGLLTHTSADFIL